MGLILIRNGVISASSAGTFEGGKVYAVDLDDPIIKGLLDGGLAEVVDLANRDHEVGEEAPEVTAELEEKVVRVARDKKPMKRKFENVLEGTGYEEEGE